MALLMIFSFKMVQKQYVFSINCAGTVGLAPLWAGTVWDDRPSFCWAAAAAPDLSLITRANHQSADSPSVSTQPLRLSLSVWYSMT